MLATPSHDRLQLSISLGAWIWSILILLNVEPTQQHDSFLPEDPSVARIALLQSLVRMNSKNTSISTETIISTSVVDTSNPVLPQGRCTHDAGFHGDVEIRLSESRDGELGEKLGEGEELSVSSAVERSVGVVHASCDYFAVKDKDTCNGGFSAGEGFFGNIDCLTHESLVKLEVLEDFWI